MAYLRANNGGKYIWPDETGINFNLEHIDNNDIDMFLAKLYDVFPEEFKKRIQNGRNLLSLYKIGDENE